MQIEDFLRRFHKIKDAAVIGLPDRRLGEKTAAIIEIKDGVSCTAVSYTHLDVYKRQGL